MDLTEYIRVWFPDGRAITLPADVYARCVDGGRLGHHRAAYVRAESVVSAPACRGSHPGVETR